VLARSWLDRTVAVPEPAGDQRLQPRPEWLQFDPVHHFVHERVDEQAAGRLERYPARTQVEQREVARYNGPAKLNVLPRLCPLKVSAADFSHADELIARARTATGSWIDAGGPDLPAPQRFLSVHDHKKPRAIARQDLDRANGRRTASSPH
jgi:hypothetical protein